MSNLNQPIKTILHIIDTTGPGGAEVVFINLVEKLQIEGYSNIALIKGPGWVEEQLHKRGVEYYIKKPRLHLSILYYIDIIRLCRKKHVALIQAHLLGAILTCSIVGLICRIPLIATLHGQVDINSRERFVFIKNLLMTIAVNKFVAVSSSLSDYIQKRGLFNKKKIEIIYNGVATTKYYHSVKSDFKKKLLINDTAILVGSLGNIRPAKNYSLLIEAAAIIRQTDTRDFHFLIAGHQRSDLMYSLNRLAEERKVTNNIHFLGFMDDTPKFLSELDLFLLCSLSEGFSIATLEAMAAGVLVIATQCGGPEEIITNNINGILIENNNADIIARTIKTLISDKKRSEALIIAASKHVQTTFSMDAMLKNYKNLYTQIFSKSISHIDKKGR